MKQNNPGIFAKVVCDRPLRVALIEDERGIREGWARLIDTFPEFTCVCACASGEEVLRVVPPAMPDVVLMDIHLPDFLRIDCMVRLKERLPRTRIVILTLADDDELIFRFLQAGADGFLLKRTKPAEMRQSLLDFFHGGTPITSTMARRFVQAFGQAATSGQESQRLSAREQEVLKLLAKGYSNMEVAAHIQLSPENVRTCLKRIYEKMHVRSRPQPAAPRVRPNFQ